MSDPTVPPIPPRAMMRAGLASVAGESDRFAVIDLETTGLYNSDRVLEVAIVTLDLGGSIIDEWATLIDPCRDVGPTHIHGVSASDVDGAPTFEEVADEIAIRLHGACVVAHNLFGFDARMLTYEFTRLSPLYVDLGRGIDTLRLTHAKLSVACAAYSICLEGWHTAIHDARATAHLLAATGNLHRDAVRPARTNAARRTTTAIRARSTLQVVLQQPWFMTSLSTISFDGVPIDEQPYLDLLDHVISDWKITDEERAALADLAQQLGLDTAAQADAHRRFVSAMTDHALEDGLVTEEEFGELLAMASLLGVDATRVVARTARARSQSTSIQLSPGLSVCFTGEPVIDGWPVERSRLEARARALGLVSRSSVTKATHLLVAADAASRSGKAGKATSYGVPIISAELFLRAGPGDVIEADVTTVRQRDVQACATCGAAMVLDLGQNRRAGRVCELCAAAPRPAKSATATRRRTPGGRDCCSGDPGVRECGTTWERTVARDRKPKLCNNCASWLMAARCLRTVLGRLTLTPDVGSLRPQPH